MTDAIDIESLNVYLQANVDGYKGPLTLKQFKGGQSNPTYLLQASSGEYVMRRKPSGKLLKSAHAVDREYRVMSALHSAGFPVPRPYVLCVDESVIGTMFFVMEYVEGRIFWDLDLRDCARDERTAIYDQVNQTLAQLHNFDYTSLGLDDFGKPGNYFSRQISRWSGQYAASETSKIPQMNRLIEWLPENIPVDESSTVVHGDFRLDNMVIHPTEPRILAVLDWELSTIGHPLGDFTYHLMAWQIPDFGIGSSGLRARTWMRWVSQAKMSISPPIADVPDGLTGFQIAIFIRPITFFASPPSCKALPDGYAMGRQRVRMPNVLPGRSLHWLK